MYKEDFLAIGGHDELFAPQSKEDSDLFNRFVLNGYKVLQTWEGLVYHFTSRGSRFNKYAGGAAGKNSEEWLYTTTKNMRNFIRKWGTVVKHDPLMKPIIPPKYQIGFKIKNCKNELLFVLEPWCDKIYSDAEWIKYISTEQPNTPINLKDKCFNLDKKNKDGILVEIDGNKFTPDDARYIQQLPEIFNDSIFLEEDMGERFEVGNLILTINNITTYEKKLIKNGK